MRARQTGTGYLSGHATEWPVIEDGAGGSPLSRSSSSAAYGPFVHLQKLCSATAAAKIYSLKRAGVLRCFSDENATDAGSRSRSSRSGFASVSAPVAARR
jgi:hypothetical protein